MLQTWEVNLDTNGLSKPISIRRSAIAPPTVLQKPTITLEDNEAATPLSTGIADFNISHTELARIGSVPYGLPPLTKDEVLAAIALWQVDRDQADVDDATFERLRRIAATHQLPADIRFELIPSFESPIGQLFTIVSIRILVPRVDEPESTYAFNVRHQFAEIDRKNPATTCWGQTGTNGIQAGVRLVPAQQTYQIGQAVDVEFLYRSVTGKDVPATLPRFFRYDKVSGLRLVLVNDGQQDRPGGSISTTISGQLTVLRGHRMQICTDNEADLKDGVTMKAITKPGVTHYVRFTVPNPGVDAAEETLEISSPLRFSIQPLTPRKVLPLFTGHHFAHWGTHVPKHRRPTESTPDPEYIDPFQIGVSLGPADKSQIPAYYASGLQVTKVAPYSPAQAAGIEVGDIVLSWERHQIYGDDPNKPFGNYNSPNNQLRDLLEKNAKSGAWVGSFSMDFDLLDHRTGEAIRISPWFGRTAGGGRNKAEVIRRLTERKRLREQSKTLE